MSPFSVTVPDVPDRELGPLLTQLSEAGFDNPIFVISSECEAKLREAMTGVCVDGWFTKPICAGDLLGALHATQRADCPAHRAAPLPCDA